MSEATDSHYNFQVKGVKIDPYRILKAYGVTEPAQQHAIKKLLRVGKKKGQPVIRDIDEVIMALQRWREMIIEDNQEESISIDGLDQLTHEAKEVTPGGARWLIEKLITLPGGKKR